MKRTLTISALLLSVVLYAQEPQIIGGYIIDSEDSFEELEAAVLTESRTKDRTLTGKGTKIPGPVIFMTPENLGDEIGSIAKTKHPFLVKTISFTVDENKMEGCRASIRIYRVLSDGNLENIVTMPIQQDIPKTESKATFVIAPQERIFLEPGEYYVSFSITDLSQEILDRWKDSHTWDENDRYSKYREDRIFFPLYIKNSFRRYGPDKPLLEWGANIGLEVKGKIIK